MVTLRKLKTLDLTNNDLQDVPSELGLMNNLVRLSVEGNPLKRIRSNIRTAGAIKLKKYIASRISEDQLPTHMKDYNMAEENAD